MEGCLPPERGKGRRRRGGGDCGSRLLLINHAKQNHKQLKTPENQANGTVGEREAVDMH